MKATSNTGGGHLDLLALDALRAGEGTQRDAAHVASCPRCSAALAELARAAQGLKEGQPQIPAVPRELELRILRGYRESIQRPGRSARPALARRWALPAAGLAAAAALTLTIRIAGIGEYEKRDAAPARVAMAPERLDAIPPCGSVDIVDAFRLARALKDGRQVAAAWDVDGNGVVDDGDVQKLARRAVAL